jgi:hypothetical protein
VQLLLAAVVYYDRGTRALDAQGRWALWSLVAITALVWITGPWSPPPPSVTAIAVATLALAVVFPLWGMWNRSSQDAALSSAFRTDTRHPTPDNRQPTTDN